MFQYNIHFINPDGQISVHPEVLNCADDAQARDKARLLVEDRDVELWEGRRLVDMFPHK
jgi:hypothetical protein